MYVCDGNKTNILLASSSVPSLIRGTGRTQDMLIALKSDWHESQGFSAKSWLHHIFLFTCQELLVQEVVVVFHTFVGFVCERGGKLVPSVALVILLVLYQRRVKPSMYFFFSFQDGLTWK